jgi:serine/threonine-protein kinase HipA
MHLKNFSLIETSPGSQSYILSPAYDMLPTNLVLPEDTEQMALTLNGKKSNLRKNDFMVFAETIDLPRKAAEKMIEKISSMQPVYVSMCLKSYLPESMKTSMEKLLKGRMFKSHN